MTVKDLHFFIEAEVININKNGYLVDEINTNEKGSYQKIKGYYNDEIEKVIPESKSEITLVLL